MKEGDLVIITDLDVKNFEEVIKELGSILIKRGFVKPSFIPATIEREKSVPTGLELSGGINVALPHAGVEHVIRPALGVAKLKREVIFRKMDDPEAEIPVKIVFMPAIEDPHSYIVTLQKLVNIFKNPEIIKKIAESNEADEIREILAQHLIRL